MNHLNVTLKQFALYVLGLFILALGVSFSIEAGFGVSPVSSLAVAITLSTGISVGATTVFANVLFILIQVILNKRLDLKEFAVQLIIAFLFGFFMDGTLLILQIFPTPESIVVRSIYLLLSLLVVALGLLGYITAKLPLMPYDALTYAISERFQLKFSKAKIISDFINVSVAGMVCLLSIQSLGSIGIGTLLAAYFIGKILGWLIGHYQKNLQHWVQVREGEV
ncbi:YczE/YyaS/YitT family protein [Bacillus sp. Marseille-P3661]|uniref:YczE/YyaS/YitT family protein n=1 Tax=Bacillus sp. Marseille-P3661 TaxID=1936234 RepID=UPI000C840A50|nr:DUF6198 family protein [Bacillus sp. Marseille-P3661]